MTDLISQITADLKKQIDSYRPELEIQDVGAVIEAGDGIARVSGLVDVRAQELVQFENGVKGIAFNLEHAAAVNLKVMNSIGQVVSVILDENMSQGLHQVSWNTEGLQRGIYFLELKANGGRKASVKLIKC